MRYLSKYALTAPTTAMPATAATAKLSTACGFAPKILNTRRPRSPGRLFDCRTLSTMTLRGNGAEISVSVSPSTATDARVSARQCGRSKSTIVSPLSRGRSIRWMWLPVTVCRIARARPDDGQQKRTVVEGLEVMGFALIECDQTPGPKVERAPSGIQAKMTREHVDRDASVRLVLRNADTRSQRRQDDTEVVVLDQGPGVSAGLPSALEVQAVDLGRQIEFEEWTGHRRRVRSPVLGRHRKRVGARAVKYRAGGIGHGN